MLLIVLGLACLTLMDIVEVEEARKKEDSQR